MNKFIGIGNLGADAEHRELENGQGVLSFPLAMSEVWKDKNGERQERTEWLRCTKFGKGTEKLATYLQKGKKVSVEGSLRTSSYEKDGQKVYKTELIVANLELLSPNPNSKSDDAHAASSADTTDEIPF